jgi:hypothetical protein
VPMSTAEPAASPGEPGHEGIASGSTEPAAGWRPREPPLIVVDPAFVLDRWRPGDGAALRRMDLDPDTAQFFGYTVEQARAKAAGWVELRLSGSLGGNEAEVSTWPATPATWPPGAWRRNAASSFSANRAASTSSGWTSTRQNGRSRPRNRANEQDRLRSRTAVNDGSPAYA